MVDLFDWLMIVPVPWSKDGAGPGVGERRRRPAGIAEGGMLKGIVKEDVRSSMQSDAHSVLIVRSDETSFLAIVVLGGRTATSVNAHGA